MSKYDMLMVDSPDSIPGKMMLRIRPASAVLEFGCAEGRMTRYMKEKLDCRVSVAEMDAEAFAAARAYAHDGFLGNIEEGGWIEYFSGKSFNYILFADVLEHLRNPEWVLQEAQRFLRPDGEILISLPNIGHHDILANLYLNRFVYTELGLLDNTHIHFWGKENLQELASQAGLKIRLLDGVYRLPCSTEQEVPKEALPFVLQEAFAQREYNEVYQFFLVLQKKAWMDTHGLATENHLSRLNRFFMVNCYWDVGAGYQSSFCTQLMPVHLPEGKYRFYCAELPEGCKRVRFDPALDHFCIVSDIHVSTNICSCEIYPLNGVTINGVTAFCNMNPQMEFCVPEGVQWFEITANIRLCMGYEYGEILSAVQKVPLAISLEQQLHAVTAEIGMLRQSLNGCEAERESLALQLNTQVEAAMQAGQERAELLEQIEQLSGQNGQIAEECSALSRRLEQQSGTLAEMNRLLKESEAREGSQKGQLVQLSEQAQELRAQRDVCKEHLKTDAAYIAELEQCLRETREENQLIRQYWEQSRSRADMMELQYQCISDAQFWKMTAPLRKAADAVKRTRFGKLAHQTARSLRRFGLRATLRKIRAYLHSGRLHEHDVPASILTIQAMAEEVERAGGQVFGRETLPAAEGRCVLLISHMLDLTGAPVAFGYLAEALPKFGYHPVMIAPGDGALRQTICASGIPVMIYPQLYQSELVAKAAYLFHFIAVSTNVGAPIISMLNGKDIPILWWIHEAHVSYHPGALQQMPEQLERNVHVYCGGPHAERVLKLYRPNYTTKQLLYYVPDYAEMPSQASEFGLKYMDGKTVFAIVGMQEERKGQDILVRAVRMLSKELLAQCMFLFVGRKYYPPILSEVYALCEDFPRNVQHIEELPRDELLCLYRQIDCLICASRDDPMPIVVTEAMLLSKAIICSENAGSADILEQVDGGLIYRNNDPAALAECISFIHTHKGSELLPMCSRARGAYERHFSQHAFDNAIQAVISDLESGQQESLLPFDGMVSVVIPVYNAGDDLQRLLDSLQSQERIGSIEIITVDSGSSDGSAELAEQAGARVIRISQEQFSHSYARNLGAEQAEGEYLLFMTQDAVPDHSLWVSGMLQPLLRGQAAAASCRESPKPDCDLLGRACIWLHSRYMGILASDRILKLPEHQDYESLRKNGQLNDVACIIRKDVFLKFRYQGNYAEDLDLGIRLIRAGYQLALLSGVKVVHSHTRPAIYHMKRALVDHETLKRILPDMPFEKLSAQAVANRILTAYCVDVLYINDAVKYNPSGRTWQDFCSWTEGKLEETLRQLKTDTSAVVSELLKAEIPYADTSMDEFLSSVFHAYAQGFDWDRAIAGDQFYYITRILSQYLSATAEPFGSHLICEICDLLIKHLGQCAGMLLAAYAFSHPDEEGIMNEMVQKYRSGV